MSYFAATMRAADTPRIWRLPGLSSWSDELTKAGSMATDETLAAIKAEGFTGIWFFGNLWRLMESTVFPELNPEPQAAAALVASLQQAVDRARAQDLDVWIYFNEPGGLEQNHPFWQSHPELRGEPQWHKYGFCTSQPMVLDFLRQALASVFSRLHGVAGVILITACEDITHCWSKKAVRKGAAPPTCPRCRDREPADLIGDLLDIWADVARSHDLRVIAWNWEWAYYYDDPPALIVDRVPPGVELMADLEIGGYRETDGEPIPITEYCYSYLGPSERFTALRNAALTRTIPFHAKIQINNTHELCSIPSLPVIATLHGKHAALHDAGVSGFMGTWTIGCGLTLNTFAVNLFWRDPRRFADRACFLRELSRQYFGDGVDPEPIMLAWEGFSAAFMHYPFDIPILYYGPHNDALARRMHPVAAGGPIGRSFMPDPPGDDFSRLFVRFSPDEVIAAYDRVATRWCEALDDYRALAPASAVNERARLEWGQACCIGHLLRSTHLHFVFHHARTAGDAATMRATMQAELANCEAALPYLQADPRLGFHDECQGYKFSADSVQAKIDTLRAAL